MSWPDPHNEAADDFWDKTVNKSTDRHTVKYTDPQSKEVINNASV